MLSYTLGMPAMLPKNEYLSEFSGFDKGVFTYKEKDISSPINAVFCAYNNDNHNYELTTRNAERLSSDCLPEKINP